jgi:hypothetical protein
MGSSWFCDRGSREESGKREPEARRQVDGAGEHSVASLRATVEVRDGTPEGSGAGADSREGSEDNLEAGAGEGRRSVFDDESVRATNSLRLTRCSELHSPIHTSCRRYGGWGSRYMRLRLEGSGRTRNTRTDSYTY